MTLGERFPNILQRIRVARESVKKVGKQETYKRIFDWYLRSNMSLEEKLFYDMSVHGSFIGSYKKLYEVMPCSKDFIQKLKEKEY